MLVPTGVFSIGTVPTATVAVLAAYITTLFVVAWQSRGAAVSGAQFFLAGRTLPSWVAALTFNATAQSRWVLLGLTGLAYWMGVQAFWVVVGEVLGVVIAWVLIAPRFKEFTDRCEAITIPDFLVDRFLDRGHSIRITSTLIILGTVVTFVASQLAAVGYVLHLFLGVPYLVAALAGGVVVIGYTALGGYRGVAHTDVFQGLILLFVLIALPTIGITEAGGIARLVDGLSAVDPNLVRLLGPGGEGALGWIVTLGLLGIGLAYLGAPQLLVTFMAVRDREEIARGRALAFVSILVYDVGAVLTGLTGRFLFPGLEEASDLVLMFSDTLLSDLGGALVLVALLAAIHSTVDSLLVLASACVARDLGQKVLRPSLSDAQAAHLGRWVIVALGFGTLAVALFQPRLVTWFTVFAWSGLAAAFVPVVVCSLFWKGTTRVGALWGMLSGFITAACWVLFFKERFFELYELLPGIGVGFVVLIAVSLRTHPPLGVEAEMREVEKAVSVPGF